MRSDLRDHLEWCATVAIVTFAAVGLAFWLTACATTPSFEQTVYSTSRLYLAAKKGYEQAALASRAHVESCYAAHPDLHGDEARAACPPLISRAVHAQAVAVMRDADVADATLRAQAATGVELPAPNQADALDALAGAATRLPVLAAGRIP